jgi:hypothetical protein
VPGLDEGREVFTAFRSGTAAGDRAIATWRGWMRRLLAWSDDPLLVERLIDLEDRLPPQVREAPDVRDPVLLHNLDVALLTQLATFLPDDGLDELHLCAPFYDRDLAAVARLLHDLQPRAVTVYVGATTNVDGPALRRALDGPRVRYRGFEPDEFTHAKIVGVIAGDRGWLLTGSANLSRSALLHPASGRGNVELAVLSATTAADVRAAFAPAKARVVDRAAQDGVTPSGRHAGASPITESGPDPDPDPVQSATASQAARPCRATGETVSPAGSVRIGVAAPTAPPGLSIRPASADFTAAPSRPSTVKPAPAAAMTPAAAEGCSTATTNAIRGHHSRILSGAGMIHSLDSGGMPSTTHTTGAIHPPGTVELRPAALDRFRRAPPVAAPARTPFGRGW